MLIVCNGVFKSGSSWLHAIVIEILRVKNIPLSKVKKRYTNNVNSPTTIIESKLEEFLAQEDYKISNYITKSHYYKINTLSKKYNKHVKFIFIERDIKDAVISHFHHFNNKFSIKVNFLFYYFFIGRLKAFEIHLFNLNYKKYFGESSFVTYEGLKTSFDLNILKICKILELEALSKKECKAIQNETSITKLREKIRQGSTKYYSTVKKDKWKMIRKGEVGDWKKYYSNSQLHDINKIIDGKATFFTKLVYYLFFTLRRRLGSVE